MKKILLILSISIFMTLSAANIFAGAFVQDAVGFKYDVGGGRYLENGWAWCDPNGSGIGYSYYFSPSGYMLVNTVTPDGNYVNAAGQLTINGVVMTQMIERGGYELNTASYPITSSVPSSIPSTNNYGLNLPLINRIVASNNVRITDYSYGNNYFTNAIEFSEGSTPYIVFNSGSNTSFTFDLTGDNLNYDGDFTVDVYVNGAFNQRFSQRFVELTTNTIFFAPNQNIELRVPIINDYFEQYIRCIYVFNYSFN